jgi:hypothetical protein
MVVKIILCLGLLGQAAFSDDFFKWQSCKKSEDCISVVMKPYVDVGLSLQLINL